MEADDGARYWEKQPGVAPVKAEYVLWDKLARGGQRGRQEDDDAAEGRTKNAAVPTRSTADATPAADAESTGVLAGTEVPVETDGDDGKGNDEGGEPPSKKLKLSAEEKKQARKDRKAAAQQQAQEDKAAKKKERGSNKGRTFAKTAEEVKLCSFTAVEKECTRLKDVSAENAKQTPAEEEKPAEPSGKRGKRGKGKGAPGGRGGWGDGCPHTHNVSTYLASKPEDICSYVDHSFVSDPATFAHTPVSPEETGPRPFLVPSPTTTPVCPLFAVQGECPFGYRCRFLSTHVNRTAAPADSSSSPAQNGDAGKAPLDGFQGTGSSLVVATNRVEEFLASHPTEHTRTPYKQGEANYLTFEVLRALRKRRYPLPETKAYLESIGEPFDQKAMAMQRDKRWQQKNANGPDNDREAQQDGEQLLKDPEDPKAAEASPIAVEGFHRRTDANVEPDGLSTSRPESSAAGTGGSHAPLSAKERTVDLAPPRPSEKPRLHWGKSSPSLYLAPLTTVGNLPFRRLCSVLGADITCGEMALSQDLLSASPSEWSLVRRWKDERCFGTQIAGSRPQVLVPTAEVLSKECQLDFVDLNCGCPIDLVFKKGAGSALLDHANKLGKSLVGMSRILNAQDIPLTAKLRTGVSDSHPTAHKLIARMQGEWGVSAVTLHGRSRQQRYTRRADWSYIASCVKVLRNSAEELGEEPIPIYGNGDCFDYREYYEDVEQSGATGVMVARGGLIKPWLFTEIKERRDWDISARERLDLYGKLASFGLQHWGSDTQGINTTRRFLCEAISFQYRYVPVGLLERLPARINERPFPFKGRDELETLLASPNSDDWVKLSNLFLGPPPDNWTFLPKHKSNAQGGGEENG